MGAKKAILLQVSAPFHSPLMETAGQRLGAELAQIEINDLTAPVVTNVEAEPNTDKERVQDLLVRQVSNPVKWEDSMNRMFQLGVERFVEVGPGKVLIGLLRRINGTREMFHLEDLASLVQLKGA
jgi:[acyl-carrier-protein] S-malonyltransferase